MKRRHVATAVTALSLAALATAWAVTRSPKEAPAIAAGGRPEAHSGPSADSPTSPVEVETARLRLSPDTRLAYRARVDVSTGRPGGASGGFVLSSTFELSWTVIERTASGLLLEGRLTNLSVGAGEPRTAWTGPDSEVATRFAAEPFYAVLGDDGRIPGIYVPHDSTSMIDGMRRALTAAFQFARELGSGNTRWQTTELDQTGEVIVTYEQHGDTSFTKKKQRYLSMAHGADLAPANGEAAIIATAKLVRTADGVIESLTSDETLTVALTQDPIENRSHVELQLIRVTPGNARRPSLDELRFLPLYSAERSSGDAQRELVRLAGTRSASELLASLHAIDPAAKERWTLHDQLSARFRLEGASVKDALQALRSGRLSAHAKDLVLSALGDAHTPEAQRALLELAGDRKDPALQTAALRTLAMLEEPTVDTLRGVKQLVNSTPLSEPAGRAALLAYGSVAGHGAGSSHASLATESAQAARGLLDGFRAARNDGDRTTYLDALGNAGSPEAVPELQKLMENGSEWDRMRAIDALRKVPGAAVDSTLLGAVVNDPSADVQRQAIQVVGSRPYTQAVEDALRQVVTGDEDPLVRSSALDVLARNAFDSKTAEALLREAATKDSSQDVREHAQALLDGAPGLGAG